MAIERPPGTEPARRTVRSAVAARVRRVSERVDELCTTVTERAMSLYAAAVLRIGYGLLYLAFLLREFPHRDEMWGPGSPWTPALANRLFDQTGWFSILTLADDRVYFEFCYVLALVISTLFVLGWRTRAVSVLFAVVVISFHGRAIFMSDGGDNLILLMSLYLVFTACGRRWSLDARRNRLSASRRKSAGVSARPGGSHLRYHLSSARRQLSTVSHNCAMFVIAVQICIVYGCAGLYKVQGGSWQDGTALHYVLNLDLFQPWPALSEMVASQPILIAVVSYLTVLLQVAFPFVLFSRIKYVVLTMLLAMHLSIAVLMGLPLFSGIMIVADAVFLPDRFYGFLVQRWRQRAFRRGGARGAGASSSSEDSLTPPLTPLGSGPTG